MPVREAVGRLMERIDYVRVIGLNRLVISKQLCKGKYISVCNLYKHITQGDITFYTRALCGKKLLPVTNVLVDTWMLTVKLVYKLSNVPDDLKWATNTHMTPFTLTFKA